MHHMAKPYTLLYEVSTYFYIYIYIYMIFLKDNYNMLLTLQLEFPPLNPQALCAWKSANSSTIPWLYIYID